ncbi:MAG: transposase [Euryarchaeota archaeon]|nr:transposase [Euryarchaeota archaeon]
MEQWAREWLEEQRAKGVKCLEVKMQGNNHYVYHSTSYWDKELKKPRKTSKYLGKLDPEKGLIKSGTRQSQNIRNITEYGNSMLLHDMMKDLKPLLRKGFPDCWREVSALAMVRVTGGVPLKRVNDVWEKLYDAEDIKPHLNTKKLSTVLHTVGMNRAGQNIIFNGLIDQSIQLVYDLSSVFSRSISISQAERGYNKDMIQVPQINLALLCSADSGLPTMIRALPGSVKDITTLYNSICELNLREKILVRNRGFFSMDVVEFLSSKHISYVLPTRRNSHFYDRLIHLNGHLYYHDRLIRYGKRKSDNFFLYLFEDQDLMLEERKTLYRRLDDGKIDKNKLRERMKKAGMILILSNMDVDGTEIYELYKGRETVEKMFDTYITVLEADKIYLQDDASVFGHVFISFLSLYIHCKLEQTLKKGELNRTLTPIDLLFKYGKVYHVDLGDRSMVTEVPRKVRNLDEILGLDIFPKVVRS